MEHPLGFPIVEGSTTDNSKSCSNCVWAVTRGRHKHQYCVGAGYKKIESNFPACKFWLSSLDCLTCGACCGPAYDAVEVSRRDPVRKTQPDWIVQVEGRYQMKRRSNNTCLALQEDLCCTIYADRPKCCRDFAQGGSNCWFARRRLGLP